LLAYLVFFATKSKSCSNVKPTKRMKCLRDNHCCVKTVKPKSLLKNLLK